MTKIVKGLKHILLCYKLVEKNICQLVQVYCEDFFGIKVNLMICCPGVDWME